MQVKDKVVIVTGAASGLGHATAKELLAKGAKVALFDLNEPAGLSSANTLFCKVDVTSEESVSAAIQATVQKFGAVHVCVNCAGVAPAQKILDKENKAMPLADFAKGININLIGTFNVARLAAEQMAKNSPQGEAQERGLIVNTASVAAYEGQMGQSTYAASKGAIVSLSLPMARDLAKLGIRVNAIAPGIMGTPMLLNMPQTVQDALVNNIQFPKRMGLPSEFGQLVIHLIENAYINAECIRLDAAIRMQPR
jgi:NAD(P)-dependent dehydrogenase (short-subunit alcohol dehydrogenase family)